MRELILRYALENAVKYDGKADIQSVLGKVLSAEPSLRKDVDAVQKEVAEIISEVNQLTLDEQKSRLKALAPKKEAKKPAPRKLPELSHISGKVVMRFAPNPNGPLSLGHARPALLNWFYVKQYKGTFILRFDDTDAKIKPPVREAYAWIKKDLEWLGIKPNLIVRASSRFPLYYKYAEKLITMDKAYVCSCEAELKRQLLMHGKSCLCRDFPADEQLKRWKKMFSEAGFKEGGAVLRIKTNLADKNPANRDWVAFRIIEQGKHPLKKARVWPLLNFASAIDDKVLHVTHILRGVDLQAGDERQKYIYDFFGWQYPVTIYNGKIFVAGIGSTSESDQLIKEKKLTGWDDPRLGTLLALRKRGFQAEAIRNFIFDLGVNRSDVHVAMDTVAAYNKHVIEKTAHRYFFINNPVQVVIKNAPPLTVKLPLHPDNPKAGKRKFKTRDRFYIQDTLILFKLYRLIGLFNFRNRKFVSQQYDEHSKATLIHWLPANGNIKAEVVMPDNSVKKGLIEYNARKIKIGEVVQLYRFGFCRLDSKNGKMVFYYSHA